ncbi:ethanolamine ammonia-lyase reactivating factor EutA, partial [Bacillus cereus]|uniref:ethanolamine ammonia-lyase reactivating factor EutA n=2 Tax=Bacillaceae TaxID=186817 RepID=UPI00366F5230
MVQLVKESVGMEVHSPFYERCITHKGLKRNQNAKCISFTGGVADSIYNDYEGDPFLYGDIGIMFGAAIRQSSILKNFTLVRPDETIRATVVGAGSHTTEISGSTITYTGDFFPIKNIPVLKLTSDDERLAPEEFGERMREKLEWFKVDGRLEHVAIALRGKQSPTFKEIEKLGTGLALGMAELMSKESPIIIITEEDIGK